MIGGGGVDVDVLLGRQSMTMKMRMVRISPRPTKKNLQIFKNRKENKITTARDIKQNRQK